MKDICSTPGGLCWALQHFLAWYGGKTVDHDEGHQETDVVMMSLRSELSCLISNSNTFVCSSLIELQYELANQKQGMPDAATCPGAEIRQMQT